MVGLGRMGILLNRGSSSSSSQTGSVPYTSTPSPSAENNNSNENGGFHHSNFNKDHHQQQEQHSNQNPPPFRPMTTSTHINTTVPRQPFRNANHLTAETVAALPPPGQSGPSSFSFSPGSRYLSFFSSSHSHARYHPKVASSFALASSSETGMRQYHHTNYSSSHQSGGERKLCGIDMLPYFTSHDEETRDRIFSTATTSATSKVAPQSHPNYSSTKKSIPSSFAHSKKMNLSSTNNHHFSSEQDVFAILDSSSLEKAEQNGDSQLSLEERLRRERQRLHATGVTQFGWCSVVPSTVTNNTMKEDSVDNNLVPFTDLTCTSMKGSTEVVLNEEHQGNDRMTASVDNEREGMEVDTYYQSHYLESSNGSNYEEISVPVQEMKQNNSSSQSRSIKAKEDDDNLRILIPLRGNIYIQDGIGAPLRLIYDKNYSMELLQEELNRITPSPITTTTNYSVNNNDGLLNTSTTTNDNSGSTTRKNHRVSGSAVGRDNGAIDPQLSPDGRMVAFVVAGDIYVVDASDLPQSRKKNHKKKNWNEKQKQSFFQKVSPLNVPVPIRMTYGANQSSDDDISDGGISNGNGSCISHGLADFVAQEEMDRYRGFWWNSTSDGIVFTRVDESLVPPYRISHQGRDGTGSSTFEDHRYPFAGENNPKVTLGFVELSPEMILNGDPKMAKSRWESGDYVKWLRAPSEADEYLARVCLLPDGCVCAQWENREQTALVLVRIDTKTGESTILLNERSNFWINLHHMFRVLPSPISPYDSSHKDNKELPKGSFSFLFASERTGYSHLYLYTYIGGSNKEAILVRAISAGKWVVESIAGLDMEQNVVYVTGTYDSPLERHLYSLPLVLNRFDVNKSKESMDYDQCSLSNGNGNRLRIKAVISSLTGNVDAASSYATIPPPDPIRLTKENGMHNIVMDQFCQFVVDTSSDLKRPTSVKIYSVENNCLKQLFVLQDNANMLENAVNAGNHNYTSPEIIHFKTSDQSEELYAALYLPDPKIHGPGPYPLIASVYGGPHVQRVNRSWSQSTDMRAQRLRSLGFVVVKCDNRGSSRRGHSFESGLHRQLGRLEVLDQVTAVRQLVQRGVADPNRVGIYGWSYGGYLAAMCLFRAPDVFHAAVAGAPVTSWDGYDTHYTERYMGTPQNNREGYRESALLEHVGNMRGQLMIVHGLIDENVHFRHTARLINRLIGAGKAYDLLLFPDERHSPRRLRDRVYMEQRISDYFVKNLGVNAFRGTSIADDVGNMMRPMAGHL